MSPYNGFTFPLSAIDNNSAGSPTMNMGYQEVASSGTYSSPTVEMTATSDGCMVGLLAFGGE